MPSFRIIAQVMAVRQDTDPPRVVDIAREVVAESHHVEKVQLDLPGGVPTITVRFVVPPANEAAENTEALGLAQAWRRRMSEFVDVRSIQVRRRVAGRFELIGRA